jgi:pSer/pThr/pTyr-binding forkhead associated (FHA) protein
VSRYALHYFGTEIKLADGDFVIGRDPDCDLRLDDQAVSRRHARLRVQGEEVWLEDLESQNGVLLNGTRIAAPTRLAPRDRVRVGQHKFELREVGAEPGATDTMNLGRFLPK